MAFAHAPALWRQGPGPADTRRVNRQRALVLGDDTRSFLAIVRSLGRRGIEVHAAPLDFTAPALRSRYLTATQYLPLWVGDGAEWLDAMEALLRARRFDAVIPCNETGLLPLARHRARFEPLTCLAIPHDRAIAALFDKHATRELAASLGIAVSPGRLLRAGDDAAAILAEFGTPVMLKPRRSYALDTLDSRGKVRALRSADELRALLAGLLPDDHLLEGFFAGRGVGFSVLADSGRVLQSFEHHRIRENRAGGSYYRVSATPTPELARACAFIIGALDYTGVAMFEFRVSADAWVLLEVNARPWGSLPLPVALGVDFPARWVRLLTQGVATPSVAYPAGIYGRNLAPDLAELAEAMQDAGVPAAGGVLLRRLAELGRNLTGRERQDTFSRDDMRPGLGELGAALRGGVLRIGRALPGAARIRDLAGRRRLLAALGARTKSVKAGRPWRLLFVCAGNICRSPYAAAVLASRPDLAGWIETASAGTLPREGRPTPAAGLLAAQRRGIDLHAHCSRHLSREAARAADVILVFDEANRRAVMARDPRLRGRIVLLGDLDGLGAIGDPVDGDGAVFMRCYARIDRSVAALAELLAALRRQAARRSRPSASPGGDPAR